MTKAIIFDYDGVLVDSLAVALDAYKEIARFVGVKEINTIEELRHVHVKTHHEIYDEWGLTPEQRKRATEMYYTATNRRKDQIVLLPGMKDIINALSQKYRLAIASGTSKKLIAERLKVLGIGSAFETIVSAEDVQNLKPAPDMLNVCIQKMNLKKEEVVYVGDMLIDIKAGRAANIKTIILCSHSWNSAHALREQNPDVLIERPEQLLDVIP